MARFLSDDEVFRAQPTQGRQLLSDDDVLAPVAEGPGLASNAARNAGERALDLAGNLVEGAGTLAKRGEEWLTELFGGVNPGVIMAGADELRAEGYEPDLTINGFGVDFTSRMRPELVERDVSTVLRDTGRAVENTGLGYQPEFTIDRALDDPSVKTVAGAVAEQGPAALADMAGLFLSTPSYLLSRTQEISEERAANQGRAGEVPTGEDLAAGGGAAALSTLIDRIALGRLLPGGGAVDDAARIPAAAARGAVTEAGTEAVQESIEYAGETAGTERGFDLDQMTRRALGGALIGGPVGGVVRAGTSVVELRQAVRDQITEAGGDPATVTDEEIDAHLQRAMQASDESVLDPDALEQVVADQTGTNRPAPVGEGLAPRDARAARRQVERELGDLFTGTDVLRREDVDVTPDGLNLREGARPAQDPVGRQANPKTLATYIQAADALQDMGAEVNAENVDAVATYIEQGLNPREAANTFRRAALSDRMRPVPDMRQELGRERTRQVAEEAFRIAEARRRRFAQQSDEQYRRDETGTLPGDYRAGAAPTAETTPRMRQERAEAASAPPRGVGEQSMQAPRVAVDRAAEARPGGLRGEVQARAADARVGQADAAAADTPPREGQVYEGQVERDAEPEETMARQQARLEQRDRDAGLNNEGDPVGRDPQPGDRGGAGSPESAPEQQAAPVRLASGEDLIRNQVRAGPLRDAGLSDEQLDAVASEVARRSTDAVTGWVDARGGSMKGDALASAQEVAASDEQVTFVSIDIANLGGLNKFHNDIASAANADFRAIADIVAEELDATGATLKMRTGGDEMGAFVQGADATTVDAAMQRAAERVREYAEQRGFAGIEHAKTGEPDFGVGVHWATADVQADGTAQQVYDESDSRMKARREDESEGQADGDTRQEQPAAPDADTERGRPEGGEAEPGSGPVLREDAAEESSEVPERVQPGRDEEVGDDAGKDAGGQPRIQFYSGVPLDALADAVRKVVGAEGQQFRFMAEKIGHLLQDAKDASGGVRADSRPTKRSLATDLWRVTLGSLDGDFRVLAGKFNSPTLKSLPDMFHATAGSDAGVGQTFDEAVQARNSRLKEVDELSSFMRDNGITKPEQHEQVVRLVENPRAPRRGAMGEAARRIEAFLKEELAYMREAGVEIGEVRDGYFPRDVDSGKVAADPDTFIRQATKAYQDTGMSEADAKEAARAYWESIVYGVSGRPGVRPQKGQTPKFVQSRRFSKAAAERFKAFRINDIDAVLGQYTMRATKRAEIARRFGDNWSDWDQTEQKILAEDPAAQAVLPSVRDRVAMSAGIRLDGMSHAAQVGLSMLRTWTTLATLPKAAFASIGELVIAPMRGTTGSIPGDIAQHTMNVLGHMHNLARTLSGLGRSEQIQASFELAEDIGIIAGTGHNALMAARFAGGDPVGRIQSEVLASFFRRNLLEYLTNYTRVTTMQQGQVFLRRLAKQMERYPERAGYFMRELGVPKGQEGDFAAWLRGKGDGLPTPAEVDGPMAKVYRNALQRFTDQTVQRPSASTRPKYASHPLGAVIFQLQAFGYAFQKNVLNRTARIYASDLSALDKVAFSAGTFSGLALLVGLQGLVRYWRDELFAPELNDRKTMGAMVEGAISQAGLFGVADPYMQSLTGVRYQRNPLQSFTGPALGGVADASGAFFNAALNNSENTNTGERNLARATYDWFLEPIMQTALTAVPAGPLTGKLANFATIYAVPAGREPFTDAAAGEANRRVDRPIEGTIEWLMGDEPAGSRGSRSSSRSASRRGGREGR